MALKDFAFKLLNKDGYAREGIIETHRGVIRTPAFMPVGTQATVKACTIDDIKKTCLLYTSPSPRDLSTSRMPSSA